jgi:hypothetical protein
LIFKEHFVKKPAVLFLSFLLLMFLSATTGWAKEQWAEVVRVVDIYNPQDGTTGTQIMFDSHANGRDGRPDMLMVITNSDRALFSILLKEYLPVGAVIIYDDEFVYSDGHTSALNIPSLLSINGEDILDLFPGYEDIFVRAARKRAAARQGQRSR